MMLIEDKKILWRLSASALGMALPAVLVGRSIMFVLLAVGLLSGLFATKGESLRASVRQILESKLTLLIIAMLGAWLASVAVGIAPMAALDKWSQMVLVALVAGLVFMSLREMPGAFVEVMLKALAITTMAMIALALTDALLGYERLSAALHGADKALTPYRLNFFSSALVVIIPFIWARLIIKWQEAEPFAVRAIVPVLVLTVAAVVACGGRAGWVGLAVSLPLFAALAARYHGVILHAKHWLMGVLALGLGAALYILSHGWGFVAARINPVLEAHVGRGIGSGRLDIWGQVLEYISTAPWLGIGPMGYRHLPNAIDMHPHNWVLQLQLETGMIGLVLFIGLMTLVGRQFYGYARANLYGVAALSSLAAFLATGLTSTSIFNVWWVTFLVMSMLTGWRAGWSGAATKVSRKAKASRVLKAADLLPGLAKKK
jgi:O-antigen ligase